jgi:capsular exopolysaccharide synthesis family protein
MQKAERDGQLTWGLTDERPGAPPPLEPPPIGAAASVTDAPATWVMPMEPLPPITCEDGISVVDEGVERPPLSSFFVVATEPGSLAAEQYRLLRTRLEGREHAGRTQLLVVTSPRLGEGKTTTSANLALSMAQEFQHRVLLVEADLRRPGLAGLFGARPGPGLADVLLGAATLDDALVAIPGQPLLLLPAGDGVARSTELLASPAMQQIVDTLRTRFDRIVFDTPPMTLSDTHVLVRLADGVLIVVRSGVTPRPAVERALAGLDRRKLLGLVLNEVDARSDTYSYPGPYDRSAVA